MKLRRILVLVSFLLPILVAKELRAQTTTSGGLTGVVTDQSLAVVTNANVQIRNSDNGILQSTRTDQQGVYRFFFVAPAKYALTVTHDGFRTESRAVNVLLGPPVSLNIALKIASSSTSVEVSAEAPLIHAENGDVSTTMSARQISEVPNPGNDLTYIAQTAPGAIMNTDTIGAPYAGNFSILGMPGTANVFTLNGMNNNNTAANLNNTGVTGMMLGQNEIQEASIISNGYSGQFGGAAGTSVNYLTKSGSNQFHGNAQYYWNGSVLNANDWFSNAQGQPRPFDIAHQWAGSLGGPIKKDNLFFFFDAEGIRVILPNPWAVTLPTAEFESVVLANIDRVFGPTSASHSFYKQMFNLYDSTPGASSATPGTFTPGDLGCDGWTDPNNPTGLGTNDYCARHFYKNFDGPSNDSIVSGRVDANLGARDRLFFLAQYGFGRRELYIDAISPVFDAFDNQSSWQSQLSETHTLGPTAANQFLLAGTYVYSVFGVANPAQAAAVFPTDFNWWNEGNTFASIGGEDFQFGLHSPWRTTSYQISDDLAKTQGTHKFGVGVIYLRTYNGGHQYNWSGTGQILPQTVDAFYWGGVDPDPSKANPNYTSLGQTYPAISFNPETYYSLGFYGQDEWHARSNLTLTLALRADHQSNPVCETDCLVRFHGPFQSINHDPQQPYNQALSINQKHAFFHTDSLVSAPRFSFAWQPFGVSHNTVVRGGIGIFYDPVPGGQGGNLFNNPPNLNTLVIHGYPLAPGEKNSLSQNSAAFNAAYVQGFASGETLAQIQAANPFFVPPTFVTSENIYRSPQYQKWSLQAQQGFGHSSSLTVSYFGHHGIHEFAWNGNANAFGFGPYPTNKCGSPPVSPCYDSRFGRVGEMETNLVSNYNGMVISLDRRFASGLLRLNYTYSHGLDEVSNGGYNYFTYSSNPNLQDPSNPRGSYGAADYDVRHSINASYVWELPLKAALRGHGPDLLMKGWQASGTVFARTAFPYTVIDTGEVANLTNNNNFGGVIYSVPVAPLGPAGPCGKGAAIPLSPRPCQPPQVTGDGSPAPGALYVQSYCETGFNKGNLGVYPSCITAPAGAVAIAQGRNRFRGPSYFNTDFAIVKNTKIRRWENGVLTIGAQFFNLFNHANLANPDNWMADQTFGEIYYLEQSPTSILGSGLGANVSQRMIQLRAQIKF
jgi:hypothetical protein